MRRSLCLGAGLVLGLLRGLEPAQKVVCNPYPSLFLFLDHGVVLADLMQPISILTLDHGQETSLRLASGCPGRDLLLL